MFMIYFYVPIKETRQNNMLINLIIFTLGQDYCIFVFVCLLVLVSSTVISFVPQ